MVGGGRKKRKAGQIRSAALSDGVLRLKFCRKNSGAAGGPRIRAVQADDGRRSVLRGRRSTPKHAHAHPPSSNVEHPDFCAVLSGLHRSSQYSVDV